MSEWRAEDVVKLVDAPIHGFARNGALVKVSFGNGDSVTVFQGSGEAARQLVEQIKEACVRLPTAWLPIQRGPFRVRAIHVSGQTLTIYDNSGSARALRCGDAHDPEQIAQELREWLLEEREG